MPTPAATAEDQAESAVVRHALARGHLGPEALRRALLLRDRLAGEGEPLGLLPLLAEGALDSSCLPELREVYEQALAEAVRQKGAQDGPVARGAKAMLDAAAKSSDDVFCSDEVARIPATIREESEEMAARPPTEDPDHIQAFLRGSAETMGGPGSTLSLGQGAARAEALTAAGAGGDPSDREEEPLRRVGRYKILSELGRGGMGVVYRARDPDLDRDVAVKLIQPGTARDYLQRFRREAQATAGLRHPHLVPVFDFGTAEGRPYLVLELIEGEGLDARVKREGRLPPREAALICAKIARGLHHAHANGVLHRDVKLSNILLSEAGEPLLADFGLAKQVDLEGDALTFSGQVLGTPDYMPPEQARGEQERIDARSDVWALGVCLYEMLTGVRPFDRGATALTLYSVCHEEPAAPRGQSPDVPRDLEVVCLECLEKDTEDRYPSAQALAEDLGRVLAGEPILARPPSAGRRAVRWLGRHRLRVVSWCLAALILMSLGLASHSARQRSAADLRLAETVPFPSDARGFIDRGRSFAQDDSTMQRAEADFSQAVALDPGSVEALSWRGFVRIRRGNYGQALADLERAIALDPSYAKAYLYRGQLRLVQNSPGDVQLALADAERCLRLLVEDAEAYDLLASVQVLLGRREEAWSNYTRALELNPRQIHTLTNRIRLGVTLGKLDQCLDDCARVQALAPKTPTSFDTLGYVMLQLSRFPEAAEATGRALAISPTAPRYLARARAWTGLKNHERALSDLDAAQSLDPASFEVFVQRSIVYRAQGDFVRGLAECDRAVEVSSGSVPARLARGMARLDADDLRGAVDDLTVAVHAGYGLSNFNRGIAYYRLGEHAQALSDFSIAVERAPAFAPAYLNRALVYLKQRDYPRVLADCDRALDLVPGHFRGHWIRGQALFGLRRYAQAVFDLRQALSEFPAGDSAGRREVTRLLAEAERLERRDQALTPERRAARDHFERGRMLLRAKDRRGAREAFIKAVASDPDYSDAWIDLGSVRYSLGDHEGALEAYDRALALDPTSVMARCNRGITLAKVGRYADAISDLERALRDLPEDSHMRAGAKQALVFAKKRAER